MNEQIIEFLTELRSHNNREWFQDNKNRYDALRKGFIDEVQDLIGRISLFDPEVAGLEAKDCLFRIYRDIRFSPDKTPYKCHFAAYISQGGRASERGGYYIHPIRSVKEIIRLIRHHAEILMLHDITIRGIHWIAGRHAFQHLPL